MNRKMKKQLTRKKFESFFNTQWKPFVGSIHESVNGKVITWAKKPHKYVSIKNNGIDKTYTAKSWRELASLLNLGEI